MKFTLLFILLATISIAQEDLKDEYVHDFERVYDTDTITYYGIDLSNFGLFNPEKIGQEATIMKYFPPWMSQVNEKYDDLSMESILKKGVDKDLQSVQSLYKSIREEWITFEEYTFGTSKIQEIVKAYELKKDKGVGLVLIIESFNKQNEYVRVNFTFFDIATREVLWNIESQGNAMGAGMSYHWSQGIIDSFYTFKVMYRAAIKKVQKSKK